MMYSIVLMAAMGSADLQIERTPRRFRVSAGCDGAEAGRSGGVGCGGVELARRGAGFRVGAGCDGASAGLGLFGIQERRSGRIEARASARAARHAPATAYYASSAAYVAAPVETVQSVVPPAAPPKVECTQTFKVQPAPVVIVQRPVVVRQLRRPVYYNSFNSDCPTGNCPGVRRF